MPGSVLRSALILVLLLVSSHSLLSYECVPYRDNPCGVLILEGGCYINDYLIDVVHYYIWDGSKYVFYDCAPQPICPACDLGPPCLCLRDGVVYPNYDCLPCDGSDGSGGSGPGGPDDDSGGGGCDLCSTLSQSNYYLDQILERLENIDIKLDLSEIIRRLDRIINNQGIMITKLQGIADDMSAVRSLLSGIDNRLVNLTNIVNTKLGNIEVKLDDIRSKLNRLNDIHSVLQDMRELIELQGQKLDVIKDLISMVWDYLRDDQAFTIMQYLTAAQLAYLEARLQYFYNTLFLTMSSYGDLSDLLYFTFSSQYQRLGNTSDSSDLIRVVGGGFVPDYYVAVGTDEVVLYELGLLEGAVSGWLTAVNTHYLPLASFPNFVIYLNLDHPEAFWLRQILRLMIGVSFIFFFVKRRYEEVTAFFVEVGDNA
jgi:hypothetical protein